MKPSQTQELTEQAEQDRLSQAIRQNNQHYIRTVVCAALEDLVSVRQAVELSAKQQALKETGQDTLPAHWTHHRSEAYQKQVQRSLRWISGSLEEVLTAAHRHLTTEVADHDECRRATKTD
jgi:hypothetical protein